MTAVELYEALNKAGIDFEVQEIFDEQKLHGQGDQNCKENEEVLRGQIKNRFTHRLSFRGIYDLYDSVDFAGNCTQVNMEAIGKVKKQLDTEKASRMSLEETVKKQQE